MENPPWGNSKLGKTLSQVFINTKLLFDKFQVLFNLPCFLNLLLLPLVLPPVLHTSPLYSFNICIRVHMSFFKPESGFYSHRGLQGILHVMFHWLCTDMCGVVSIYDCSRQLITEAPKTPSKATGWTPRQQRKWRLERLRWRQARFWSAQIWMVVA